MAANADVNVVINAQDNASGALKNFGNSVDGVGSSVSKAGSQLETFTKAVVFGNTIYSLATDAVNSLKNGLKDAFDNYESNQNTINQINQQLQDTHDVSGATAKGIEDYATQLSNTTPISKDAALAGDQVLLKYSSIGKDVFPQAQKAVADLAETMAGGGTVSSDQMTSAAQRLGVALNDPATSLGRLKMAGISLTSQQEDAIKTMENSGDKAGAQKLLIDDLANTMGGSATNASKTLGNQIEILRQRTSNLSEEIVGHLINGLEEAYTWYQKHQRIVNDVAAVVLSFAAAIALVWAGFQIFAGAVAIINLVKDAWAALELLMDTNPIILIITAIIAIGILLVTHWQEVKAVAEDVWHSISGFFTKLWSDIDNIFDGLIKDIKKAFGDAVGFISEPFKLEFDAVARLWNDTIGKLNWKVPSWIPGLGGKEISAPQLPILDNGGIVSSPTVALLAANSKPEAIVPLDKAGGMGGTVNITVKAQAFAGSQIEARQFAQQMWKALQDVANQKNTTVDKLILGSVTP